MDNLTDTHVPPRAAFNTGKATRSMYDVDGNMVMSKAKLGGIRTWGHCEACRRATSPWDDEYVRWAGEFTVGLVDSPNRGARPGLVGMLPNARPGRFARAAIAGLSAGAEGLYATHPGFVEDIVAGRAPTPDSDLRFIVGVTPVREKTYVGGGHGGVLATISLDPQYPSGVVGATPTLSALIHFPPFSLVLVDCSMAAEYPHADCTAWLRFGVDEVVPEFKFALPGVRLVSQLAASAESFDAAIV